MLSTLALCLAAATVRAADVSQAVEQLSAPDGKTRAAAARELYRAGRAAAVAVDPLLKALADKDPLVRAYAARALGEAGEANQKVMTGLAGLLNDKDARVRDAAADAIRDLAPEPEAMMPPLDGMTASPDPGTMLPVIEAIVAGGEREMPRVIEALKKPDMRYWAAVVVAELGPVAKAAVPALRTALKDQRPEVQLQTLIALGEIGPAAEPAVNDIAAKLKSKQPALQYAAAFALANIGSPRAQPLLGPLANSPDEFLKVIAFWGLAKLSPDDAALRKAAVLTFVRALSAKDDRVRQAAARALAEIKADPAQVTPVLIAELKDADPGVRANVADALAALGPGVVPRVAETVSQPDLRMIALATLRRLGLDGKEAGPALEAAINAELAKGDKGDNTFVMEAVATLGAIGAATGKQIPLADKLLASDDPQVHRAAIYLLGKIGPPAKIDEGKLREDLKSGDARTRLIALWALLQITPESLEVIQSAVAPLTEALADPLDLVRREAAAALGKLGVHAKESLPALRELLEDPDPQVRIAARQAIEQIEEGQ